jgi:hypothetical protein
MIALLWSGETHEASGNSGTFLEEKQRFQQRTPVTDRQRETVPAGQGTTQKDEMEA